MFKNIIGGEIEEYTKLMSESRDQSVDRMIENAKDYDTNAIVDERFSTSYLMGSAAEMLVYGTAAYAE